MKMSRGQLHTGSALKDKPRLESENHGSLAFDRSQSLVEITQAAIKQCGLMEKAKNLESDVLT